MRAALHISNLSGTSGADIVDAVMAGRRDPAAQATLGDKRQKASKAALRAALAGSHRQEPLFCLRQARAGYGFVVRKIAEVGKQIAGLLAAVEPAWIKAEPAAPAASPAETITKMEAKPRSGGIGRLQPAYDVRGGLLRHPGGPDDDPRHQRQHSVNPVGRAGRRPRRVQKRQTLRFLAEPVPGNRVSGGKFLSAHTKTQRQPRGASAAAGGARAAPRQNELGESYRRMRGKLGGAAALVATARKLARIVYAVLTAKQPYRPQLYAPQDDQRRLVRSLKHLRSKAEIHSRLLKKCPI